MRVPEKARLAVGRRRALSSTSTLPPTLFITSLFITFRAFVSLSLLASLLAIVVVVVVTGVPARIQVLS